MSKEIIQYLKERVENIEKTNREDHKEILRKLAEIDSFRFKIVGASLAISVLITVAFQIGVLLIK